ncbi:hypothetical protein [Paenibacillus campi]|uniref:hypothetical protein n=1 Tax=Paenibacillus campi TaxID=3106031 RepID=UPI002B001EFA|nr:hypothetical protein [Paenibacillus sp. SGZ-1014]
MTQSHEQQHAQSDQSRQPATFSPGQPPKFHNKRHKRHKRRLLGSLLVLCVLVAAAVVWLAWMVAPQREPGLAYTKIDLKSKIIGMIEQRKLETTLSPAEFNDLARQELLERARHFPPGVRVTGADFSWHGSVVEADVRGGLWGIPFGGLLEFDAVRDGNTLVLTHRYTTVKHGSFAWPHLQPIRISLTKYVPAIAKVKELTFGTEQITLTFELDLFTLPRLLWK